MAVNHHVDARDEILVLCICLKPLSHLTKSPPPPFTTTVPFVLKLGSHYDGHTNLKLKLFLPQSSRWLALRVSISEPAWEQVLSRDLGKMK